MKMRIYSFVRLLIIFYLTFISYSSSGQTSFSGFNYQAFIRDTSQIPLTNASLNLKMELRLDNITGILLYDETHLVNSDNFGHVKITIGKGIPLGNGIYQAFDSISWSDTTYFFNLFKYDTLSAGYNLLSSNQIFSVPFSIISKNTLQNFYLNGLKDVDTANIKPGDILKWNGPKWVMAKDSVFISDSVLFAVQSIYSDTSDTAIFCLNATNIVPPDTAIYAQWADSSVFAWFSDSSGFTDTADFAQQAQFANFVPNTWLTYGNAGTNPSSDFIGTLDSSDLSFKTNDSTRMVIKANGKIGIGTLTPSSNLHIVGSSGFVYKGIFGSGNIPYTGEGTYLMWYPKKAAFRGGTIASGFANYSSDVSIGNYSFAYGLNNKALGAFSLCLGEGNVANAPYSAAIGFNCSTNANAEYSFAAGNSSYCNAPYTVSIGRGNITSDSGSVALGYHSELYSKYCTGFGYYTKAYARNSTVMGYQSRSNHEGCFLYADYPSWNPSTYLISTAANQFMVRAVGGFVFYTSSDLSTGVSLASGSGSWSSMCDSTVKDNFKPVDYNDVLNNINKLHLYTWNYKSQHDSIRHIGPVAQEFYRLFKLGENDKTISTIDFDGINLAAIKALIERGDALEEKTKQLSAAMQTIENLKTERDKIRTELDQMQKDIELIYDIRLNTDSKQ